MNTLPPVQLAYQRRPDGRIAVSLENNVWDFLFARSLDLAAELPSEKFALFMPREINIEILAFPDNEANAALRPYIGRQRAHVTTTYLIGFAHDVPARSVWLDSTSELGNRRLSANSTMSSENAFSAVVTRQEVS